MPNPLKIVSIGAGNLASHIVPALEQTDCIITQVYSRDIKNAKKLAMRVDADPIDDLSEIDGSSDVYLIMVHDDAIIDIVKAMPTLTEKQFLAHTSGATKTTHLKRKAINHGSFYPLETFRKNKPLKTKGIPFLIHGSNPKTTRLFKMLARQLSLKVSEANDHERLKYHLSAVLLNNFSNHLACLCKNFLEANDLDSKVLEPIQKTTYARLLESDPCKTQTGPAIRNDIKVEQAHIELLKEDLYLQSIYKSMSQSIKRFSDEQNISE